MSQKHHQAPAAKKRSRPRAMWTIVPLLLLAVAMAIAGCSSAEESQAAPSASSTLTTTEAAPPSTAVTPVGFEELLAEQADAVPVPADQGAFLVVVVDENGAVSHGAKGADPDGNPPTPDDTFRIGSITKVFTSAVVMTLVDEGLVELDAPASDYVTRVAVPVDVTVRDLLQHTSGITNYTDKPDFFPTTFSDPAQTWTPRSIFAFVEDDEPLFEPGARFSYSNTNYLILGLLVEEVTGREYAAEVRARIVDPLALQSTYLAGVEEGPAPFTAYTSASGTLEPIDFEYTSIATGAWAAGAMVSSPGDLHTLFTALFDGQIVSASSLAAMTANEEYGLGIVSAVVADGTYGHGGGIPGYVTLVAHAPDTGRTAFWVVTGDTLT
ncbi:MAG: serine hydrolase domain-containing protein, partial [Acidimicrobiales bacterium]